MQHSIIVMIQELQSVIQYAESWVILHWQRTNIFATFQTFKKSFYTFWTTFFKFLINLFLSRFKRLRKVFTRFKQRRFLKFLINVFSHLWSRRQTARMRGCDGACSSRNEPAALQLLGGLVKAVLRRVTWHVQRRAAADLPATEHAQGPTIRQHHRPRTALPGPTKPN